MEQDSNKLADVKVEDGLLVERPAKEKRLLVVLLVIVCLTVFAVYLPALSSQAMCFDDNRYLVDNFLVRNPGWYSAWRFLSEVLVPSTVGGYYQPLTMISLMLDYALGGRPENLTIFHLTSMLFHVANTGLIIVLIYLLFGKPVVAAAVGLLFGVHPLTVEAIPWTGERKTLLAAFFALACLIIYVAYSRKTNRKLYAGCLIAYILALMSKPTSTPLPVIMLLMDFWPLKRLGKRALWEKIPFFAIGGISGIITFISQARTASVITPEQYGAMRVPFVFCHNIIFYLYKMVWPVNMSPHYVFPANVSLSNPVILAGVVGTCILIPALIISLLWTRAALTGWLVFFLMVLPTMQALQFSDVIASDKFAYLPSLGVLLVLACFLSTIWGKANNAVFRRTAIIVIVLILATAEAGATRRQIGYWKDSITINAHMADVRPNAVAPHNNLGVAYAEKGDVAKAMEEFNIVLKIDPNDDMATFNVARVLEERGIKDPALEGYRDVLKRWPENDALASNSCSAIGRLLAAKGDYEGAIAAFKQGIQIRPNNGELHSGLASTLMDMGRIEDAIKEFRIAVQFKPDARLYNNLGLAYSSVGDAEGAMNSYKAAIWHDPNNAEAHYNYGNLLLALEKPAQAAGEYEKAIKAKPTYAKAYGNLAVALSLMGKADEAIETNRFVISLDPNDPNVYYNLAGVLEGKGQVDEAIENLRKVIELVPDDLIARTDLAKMLLGQGKIEEAMEEFRNVLRIDPTYQDALSGLQKAHEIKEGKSSPQPNVGVSPANP
jgi:tetratricopeptide (TPR) repeat protein